MDRLDIAQLFEKQTWLHDPKTVPVSGFTESWDRGCSAGNSVYPIE